MADATVDAWLVARDHRSLGPLTRTLWALEAQKRQAAAEVALPAPPPEAQLVSAPLTRCAGRIGWLYAEHRVVVLIDARRHCLLQQVGSRLETLLGSLAAGPRLGDALQPTLHVSVALAARAGAPLRILLQGYRHRCGYDVFNTHGRSSSSLRRRLLFVFCLLVVLMVVPLPTSL